MFADAQLRCCLALVGVLLVLAVVVALMVQRRAGGTTRPEPLRGERVVVVGNASFHDLGEAIDGFDVVVRVNPLEPRPTEDEGRKTDVVHVNDNIPPHMLRLVPRVRHYWTRDERKTRAQLRALGVRDARVETYDFRALRVENAREYLSCPRGKNMTSGMLAVLHALQRVERVHTAGISGYAQPGHERRKGSEDFHRRNLDTFHCIDAERALLARLVEQGRVVPIDDAARPLGMTPMPSRRTRTRAGAERENGGEEGGRA